MSDHGSLETSLLIYRSLFGTDRSSRSHNKMTSVVGEDSKIRNDTIDVNSEIVMPDNKNDDVDDKDEVVSVERKDVSVSRKDEKGALYLEKNDSAWDVSEENLTVLDQFSTQAVVTSFSELPPSMLEDQELSMQEYTSSDQLQNVFHELECEAPSSSAAIEESTMPPEKSDTSFDVENKWHTKEEEETYSLLEHFDATFAPPSDFISNDDNIMILDHYQDSSLPSPAPFNVSDLANMVKYDNENNHFGMVNLDLDDQESSCSSVSSCESTSANSKDENENDDIYEGNNGYSELVEEAADAVRDEQCYGEAVGVETSVTELEMVHKDHFQESEIESCCEVIDDDPAENDDINLNESNNSKLLLGLDKSMSTIESAITFSEAQSQTRQDILQFDPAFAAKMDKKMNNSSKISVRGSNSLEGKMNSLSIQDGPSPIKRSTSNDSETNCDQNHIEEVNRSRIRRKLCNQSLLDSSIRSEEDSLSFGENQEKGTTLSFLDISGPPDTVTSLEEVEFQESDIIGRNESLWNVSMDGVGSVSMKSSICGFDEEVREKALYYKPPDFSPSPYETTLWQSSEVLLHILTFVSLEEVRQIMSVNTFSMRCLANGQLYKIIKEIVRRGKCFSSRCDRAKFWTELVETVVRQEYPASLHDEGYPSYKEMLQEGENGKWAAIINRDVMRAFGTLPPHKTNGAKGHADSIVRYLVQWDSPKNNLDTTTNMLALSVPTDKVDMQYCLGNILYALSIRFSTVGYCQGMDYVVANFMKILKDSSDAGDMTWLEEATFNLVSKLFKYYNLQHMYWPELRCLKTCCRVLDKLLLKHLPVLYDHFDHYDLNVGLFALGWFQTLFLYIPSMPSSTVCRIWDIWILERSFKIFFRVAIAILFLSQPVLLNLDAEGMMNYLNTFPDSTLLDKHILIPCALSFKVTNCMITEIERKLDENVA